MRLPRRVLFSFSLLVFGAACDEEDPGGDDYYDRVPS
jgi:hypothetical protein